MSETQKHRNFIREPMREKSVEELPGIGWIGREDLESLGFTKAYHLLGQFLLLNRDIDSFEIWLSEELPQLKEKARRQVSAALFDWCNLNL